MDIRKNRMILMRCYMKHIIVITSSPRKKGNSNALAEAFAKGAADGGHTVEIVSVAEKRMEFCRGCMVCNQTNRCVISDDVAQILPKMAKADVLVFATPVYYYSVSGQLKTFFDRTSPLFTAKYNFRDVYLLAAAAENEPETIAGTVKAMQGWLDCFPGTRLAGTVFAGGVDNVGDIAGHKALQEAYCAGQQIV